MDYVISSHVNVYKDHHAQAWNSAAEAKLAAHGRLELMAALHQSQHYPSSPIRPPAYHHHSHEAEPKQTPIENGMHLYRHDSSGAPTNCPDDVLLYVGKSRQTFHLNAQSLISGSAYFRRLLQHAPSQLLPTGSQASSVCNAGLAHRPIIIDCEAGIFESLLLLMRYGTLEALPPISAAEFFRLKKEAEFYGIHYMEPPSKSSVAESGDDHSDMSSTRSSDSGSAKSMMNVSPPTADKGAGRNVLTGRYHEGVRLACSTTRQLSELAEFPLDLANPGRLVLVSCLNQEKASIYTCDCAATSSRHSAGVATQWAVNFHHRHAFCTACGRTPNVTPKQFAEMFMAAAADYYAPASPGQSAPMEPYSAWRVSSDSTCMLRFISSDGDGPDACGCSAGGGRAATEAAPTIWAANCFYSHAFCTRCGEVAKGPVLLSLILALRYGGSNKVSRSARPSFS